mgnify:CR=1 FL=1
MVSIKITVDFFYAGIRLSALCNNSLYNILRGDNYNIASV